MTLDELFLSHSIAADSVTDHWPLTTNLLTTASQARRHRPGHDLLRHRHPGRRGQPVTLPNRDGEMLTPSAVSSTDDGAVVGQAALDVALEQPDASPRSSSGAWGMPDFGRPVAGRDFRPETLSAIILRKLVQDAELRIGPVDQAVITVPAYFDDTRRKATQGRRPHRRAGRDRHPRRADRRRAGLFVPTAPGHPEAAGVRPEQTVLVYDLGGGTFDVTLVRLGRRSFPDARHRGRRAARRQGLGRPHRRSRRRRVSRSRRRRSARAIPQSLVAAAGRRRTGQADAEQAAADDDHLHARRQGADACR